MVLRGVVVSFAPHDDGSGAAQGCRAYTPAHTAWRTTSSELSLRRSMEHPKPKRARTAGETHAHSPLVSFITPMRDAEEFLAEMLASVVLQTHAGPMELCVYDDGSTDTSCAILEEWRPALEARGVQLVVSTSQPHAPAGGCGKGRNEAVAASRGTFLCFLDADDVMAARRVEVQLALAQLHAGAIIGTRIWRDGDATPRYTHWLNAMTQEQLHHQQLREVTLCQPTWFMARTTFDRVGGYVADHPNQAEDLIFIHKHLQLGGRLVRADEPLLMYRFHNGSVTGQRAVSKEVIWALRVKRLEQLLQAAPWLGGFTIWNAGREGRRLYRSLSDTTRRRVRALCDVDTNKLTQGEWHAHPLDERLPIVHFQSATPPLLLCVKGGLTGGEFERNLASLGLVEGEQYLHFS